MKTTHDMASHEHDNKGDWIYTKLSRDLMNGVLLPNERLKIRELAQAMGTSVTPVRDALLCLVHEGALSMSSQRDIRVRNLSLEEYLEIRSIRFELEGLAAANAALKATAQDLEQLKYLVAQNEISLANKDYKMSIALNQSFHFQLCYIANMPILINILRQLWIRIGPLIAQAYQHGERNMINYHYLILEALENKDPQAARVAIQADLMSGGHLLLQMKEAEKALKLSENQAMI